MLLAETKVKLKLPLNLFVWSELNINQKLFCEAKYHCMMRVWSVECIDEMRRRYTWMLQSCSRSEQYHL